MVISLAGLILPGLSSRLSLLHQLSAHYMQMTHPNSETYNVKYINYTDRETKRHRGDMEIFPKDSLSAPEGRAGWSRRRGDEGWGRGYKDVSGGVGGELEKKDMRRKTSSGEPMNPAEMITIIIYYPKSPKYFQKYDILIDISMKIYP